MGIPDLDGRIFVIEGDPGAMRVARAITRALGGQPVHLPASSSLFITLPLPISLQATCLRSEETAVRIF